jgi:hypothetical protein
MAEMAITAIIAAMVLVAATCIVAVVAFNIAA